MTKKISPIAIYPDTIKIIKKLDLDWISKNNSKLLVFSQFYLSSGGDVFDVPYLRISPFPLDVIKNTFNLVELNSKESFRENKNLNHNYSLVGFGKIRYSDKDHLRFYGENSDRKHLEDIFNGYEVLDEKYYGERSFVVNLKDSFRK